ncbi:MAG: response regulator transcription factor [Saprospiraceae bacterium]|nr:response regulator transcription factor [Bacteroidia bacterium]NNE13885.1 response regulator transcription factor [Saprospiraceae bacterium]NNL92705.1 response regulator transcription factor [Saprospiraceae bacterium]
MNIFIISSERSELKNLFTLLKRENYKLDGVDVGLEDAISKIQIGNPDIVITNIDLKNNKHGQELNDLASSMEIPFIFITKEIDDFHYERIKNDHPNSHLISEPFGKYSLWSLVDNIGNTRGDICGPNFVRNGHLFLKKNSVFQKIKLADINFMYSEGNYSSIVVDDKKFLIKFSLSKLLTLEQFSCFVRIHRNYAVLRDEITQVDFAEKKLQAKGIDLPFGRTYVKEIRKVMRIPFSKAL